MLTLEDILWGNGIPDNSGDGTSGDTGDGGNVDPTAMNTNCLMICCVQVALTLYRQVVLDVNK